MGTLSWYITGKGSSVFTSGIVSSQSRNLKKIEDGMNYNVAFYTLLYNFVDCNYALVSL